jgi:hypothetical protein
VKNVPAPASGQGLRTDPPRPSAETSTRARRNALLEAQRAAAAALAETYGDAPFQRTAASPAPSVTATAPAESTRPASSDN